MQDFAPGRGAELALNELAAWFGDLRRNLHNYEFLLRRRCFAMVV